jgi:SpoVK/Ycf46/Vps4 family AAA+-type ATPase
MPKRIYVPLPDATARKALVTHLLNKQGAAGAKVLRDFEIDRIIHLTDRYSGSDLSAVRNFFFEGTSFVVTSR